MLLLCGVQDVYLADQVEAQKRAKPKTNWAFLKNNLTGARGGWKYGSGVLILLTVQTEAVTEASGVDITGILHTLVSGFAIRSWIKE